VGTPRFDVLVVDDDPVVCDIVCYALTSLGYEADAAGDGIEGVAFFRRGSYSPVVTDLAMPGMTGWDVAEAVRQNVGVVLITGRATEDVLPRARAQRLPLVPKPFHLDELRRAVVQALRAAGLDSS